MPSAPIDSPDVGRSDTTPARDGSAYPELCGDMDFRIGRDGTWFYHGSPIGRKPLVRLFSPVLRRDADGSFWLVTPVERVAVAVDDAPFVAVALTARGQGRCQTLRFRTNLDDEVEAGPDHPIRVVQDPVTGEPAPYVTVREGLDALIARAIFYDLVALGIEDPEAGTLSVWSGGEAFELGALDQEQ